MTDRQSGRNPEEARSLSSLKRFGLNVFGITDAGSELMIDLICDFINVVSFSLQKIDASAIEDFYGLTSDIQKSSETGYILFYQSRDASC